MTAASSEKLFAVIDETEHVYTWDYTTHEVAIALFDVNNEYFAMISRRREIADETGAMQDYRDTTHYRCHLYSKSTFEQVEEFGYREKEQLIDEMRKQLWGSDIKEVESLTVSGGRVYILGGNLMLDRVQE